MTLVKQPRTPPMAVASLLVLLVGLCGCGSAGRATVSGARSSSEDAPVVRIGSFSISSAAYAHWMLIGAATVEMPRPGVPPVQPVAYDPPGFEACVSRLRQSSAGVATSQLRTRCENTYAAIQRRILNFLITGYWLRGAAAEQHLEVSTGEVRAKFEEEKRTNYSSAAAFRRLQEASRQTQPDLEFATQTQMLSTRLLERFEKRNPHESSEQATIRAFNRSIKATWVPRTSCSPGYVVPDCKQYRPPAKPTT
jgi:hypothetical protein